MPEASSNTCVGPMLSPQSWNEWKLSLSLSTQITRGRSVLHITQLVVPSSWRMRSAHSEQQPV
uniref:Uncharacterized protein n=1 Tax=Globisporangium ultimum (strain ATCC 200006 / CBS 805.95 / DAOM BR144) TaxID=431595 RepID=K3W8I4_GLOUD